MNADTGNDILCPRNVIDLPLQLQSEILLYLTCSRDVISAACSCKTWSELVKSLDFPNVNSLQLVKYTSDLSSKVALLRKKFPNVEDLCAARCSGLTSGGLDVSPRWNLKALQLSQIWAFQDLALLGHVCHRLTQLDLSDTAAALDASSRPFTSVLQDAPALEDLSVSCTLVRRPSHQWRYRSGQNLLQQDWLAYAALHCSQLTRLCLDGQPLDTESPSFLAAFLRFQNLRRISLVDCWGVSHAGPALRECPLLEFVDLSGTSITASDIRQVAASCPLLSCLRVARCHALDMGQASRVAATLGKSPAAQLGRLRELDFSGLQGVYLQPLLCDMSRSLPLAGPGPRLLILRLSGSSVSDSDLLPLLPHPPEASTSPTVPGSVPRASPASPSRQQLGTAAQNGVPGAHPDCCGLVYAYRAVVESRMPGPSARQKVASKIDTPSTPRTASEGTQAHTAPHTPRPSAQKVVSPKPDTPGPSSATGEESQARKAGKVLRDRARPGAVPEERLQPAASPQAKSFTEAATGMAGAVAGGPDMLQPDGHKGGQDGAAQGCRSRASPAIQQRGGSDKVEGCPGVDDAVALEIRQRGGKVEVEGCSGRPRGTSDAAVQQGRAGDCGTEGLAGPQGASPVAAKLADGAVHCGYRAPFAGRDGTARCQGHCPGAVRGGPLCARWARRRLRGRTQGLERRSLPSRAEIGPLLGRDALLPCLPRSLPCCAAGPHASQHRQHGSAARTGQRGRPSSHLLHRRGFRPISAGAESGRLLADRCMAGRHR
eukprot:jgi/Botrbrau1/2423/Bobra.0395s0047.2